MLDFYVNCFVNLRYICVDCKAPFPAACLLVFCWYFVVRFVGILLVFCQYIDLQFAVIVNQFASVICLSLCCLPSLSPLSLFFYLSLSLIVVFSLSADVFISRGCFSARAGTPRRDGGD